MEKFNKVAYDNEYRKKHKAQFNVDLNIEEKEELELLLKEHGLTKVQFLRNAINDLKQQKKN